MTQSLYNPPWSDVGPYFPGCWNGPEGKQCGRMCGSCVGENEGCGIDHRYGFAKKCSEIIGNQISQKM
jgi:hypothetical protein